MPLSNLDECARAAGIELSDSERDALRLQDARALGEAAHAGPTMWCALFPAEDQPTPDKSPDELPQDDTPPSEPPSPDKSN
jgi:hypothetical protein